MNSVACPHCGKEIEIIYNYDYIEDETSTYKCDYCDKFFMYTTSIILRII